MGPKLHLELVRTIGLMLLMCELIFYMVKYVVADSGFCVLNGIVALAAKGVYASALIEKSWYRIKSVPGYLIDRYFADKEVGYVDMLEAVTEDDNTFRTF